MPSPPPAFRLESLLIRRLRTAAGTFVLILLATLGFQSSAQAQANVEGQWNTLSTQMPINPVHVALMHTGKVLIVSGSGNLPSDTSYMAAVWDPATDTVTTQPLQWDMFCNGAVILPDGRPFIMGGTAQYDPFHRRIAHFDLQPRNRPVQRPAIDGSRALVSNRNHPGRRQVMVFSGLDENGNTNTPSRFTP